jgi:hypothetical protein
MADTHDPTAEFAEREKQLGERERQIAERERAFARQRAGDWADKQVNAGRVLPRDKDGLVEFAMAQSDDALEFSEDGEQKSVARRAWFERFVESLPPSVDYGERTPAADGIGAPADFVVPPGALVDPDQLATHRKALAYAEKHGVDYVVAVAAVTRQ